MPQLDLGSVLGPQGPKGDPGNQGTVGPRGPQGEQGDAGKDATINGVNALTIETGDGLEATMTGSAYNLKLTDNTLNAVRVVPTFTRPNLLDNWYFGNPVDQRKGYIQIGGTMMYKDTACTDQFGPSAGTTPVVVYATYARPIDHGVELALYIPLTSIVRGYTGNGYGVDRWALYTDGGNVAISNGYLDIYSSKQYGTYLTQKIDPELAKALAGKTVTWSVLAVGGDIAFSANINKDDSYVDSFTIEPNTISFKTFTFPTDFTDISFIFAGNAVGHVCPIAAKLELGPTQTLAHQENGNWVLNEVPEYGEQLMRCQGYCVDITPSLIFNTMYSGFLGPSGCDFLVPIPVTLRESGGSPVVICNPSEWQVAVVAANSYFTPDSISVSQTTSGAVMLRCLFSHSLPGQHCDLRKAVDSAKLILSKDL